MRSLWSLVPIVAFVLIGMIPQIKWQPLWGFINLGFLNSMLCKWLAGLWAIGGLIGLLMISCGARNAMRCEVLSDAYRGRL